MRLSGPVLTICLSWPQVLNEVVLRAVTKYVAVVLVEGRLRLRTDRVGAVEECADVGNPLSEGAVGRCGERIHSRRTTHPRGLPPHCHQKYNLRHCTPARRRMPLHTLPGCARQRASRSAQCSYRPCSSRRTHMEPRTEAPIEVPTSRKLSLWSETRR